MIAVTDTRDSCMFNDHEEKRWYSVTFGYQGSSSSKFISTTPEAWLRRIREPFSRLGQFRRSAPAKDQPQFSSANYCRSRPNQTMFENEKAQARLSLRGIWRNAASDWCELKNFSCHGSEENRRKHWRPQLAPMVKGTSSKTRQDMR